MCEGKKEKGGRLWKRTRICLLRPTWYRGKEVQWDEEVESGLTIKDHNISSKWARYYIFSRIKRDSSGSLIIMLEIKSLEVEFVR